MTGTSIPVRATSTLECGNCGAGSPLDEHFCRQCSRILSLGRHGDYFTFFGLPRHLRVDARDVERRFRQLSRQFHPDFFHNASTSERLASLERSSYLNDAYRVLRNTPARIEYLLSLEGVPPVRSDVAGEAQVPVSLLEEVFALNEELDEIRSLREQGAAREDLAARLAEAQRPIDERRASYDARVETLMTQWDQRDVAAVGDSGRQILIGLRELMVERHYITNLLAGLEQERQHLQA